MMSCLWNHVSPRAPLPHLLGCGDADTFLTEGARITINGDRLGHAQLLRLAWVERNLRFRLEPGDYWYDHESGALGRIGGPTAGFLPSRIGFPIGMPDGCSGRGTGLYLNGREAHDVDRRLLENRLGVELHGHYRLDPFGRLTSDYDGERWHLNVRASA